MGLFSFKKKKDNTDEPKLVAVLQNAAYSGIFLDILKDNDIPYISKNQGAGGYVKLVLGEYSAPVYVYVMPEHFEKATELYEIYLNSEIVDFEE